MNSGIYQIRNLVNNKRYIGSAVNFNSRFSRHKIKLRDKTHHNPHLQASFNKYGESNFLFTVLEECDIHQLLIREQYWMDTLKPEYNICKIAGSHLGLRRSLETRKRMQTAQKNRSYIRPKGIKHSAESKLKLSIAKKGIPLSEKHKNALKLASSSSAKTHCPKGHEYSIENTYIYKKRNNRMCKKCGRLSKLKFKNREN